MKSIVKHLRFSSAYYVYLISSAILFNISTLICKSPLSCIVFFLFSCFLIFTLPLKSSQSYKSVLLKTAEFVLFATSVLLSTGLEIGYALKVFRNTSDNASTVTGAYVFALVIAVTAYLCGKYGFEAWQKLSNIIFLIPLLALIVSFVSLFFTGVSLSFFDKLHENVLSDSLTGIYAAILLVSDIYIISFMQKKENCYISRAAKIASVVSVLLILLFSLAVRLVFGSVVYSGLYSPIVTLVAMIPGFDFEDIYMFVYALCLIFRLCTKICFFTEGINSLGIKKVTATTSVLFVFLGISFIGGKLSFVDTPAILLYLLLVFYSISFILLPFIKNICFRKRP